MKPGIRLIRLGISVVLFAFVLTLIPVIGMVLQWNIDIESIRFFEQIWLVAVGVLLVVALWDFQQARKPSALKLRRIVPHSMALGTWTSVELQIEHKFTNETSLTVFDHYPTETQMKGLPQEVRLFPGKITKIHYQIRATERGDLSFLPAHVLLDSPLRWWQFKQEVGGSSQAKVYPNFAAIKDYMLLATRHQTNKIGIVQTRRRGEGTEFEQLREYREGDTMKQIDWKASARRKKWISKEFREESNQQILFILDCSRRMRSRDGDLSHFDHALNALLLLSHIALGQGDAVSLLTFGGDKKVWIPPRKGISSVNTILNSVYNLQATTHAADYRSATESLIQHQRKHALVILLSNVHEEDTLELSHMFRLIKKRHFVLLANLREKVLDDAVDSSVQTFKEALTYTIASDFLQKRKVSHNALREEGVLLLDTIPQNLPIALANTYHHLKRSGRL